ncbi:MAG: damage-inducible protein, partial [Rhodospirillales bacterium]|nr:damage-inducible protein [Rhodospirillales bacterium]
QATNKNALYDSYIRAIRWASDRIGDRGVIGFVTGSAWIERGFADGLRKCLAEEFTSLYVVHLRGDIRKNMLSRGKAGEGGNIFGQASMTGAAISLLVKNPDVGERGQIFYHDIGDYLKRGDKLARLAAFGSIAGIRAAGDWTRITPDGHGDWLDQRNDSFGAYLALGSKKPGPEPLLFDLYSRGLETTRDAWCYNPSKLRLAANIARTIAFYNAEVERWQAAKPDGGASPAITRDPTRISWSSSLETDLKRGRPLDPEDGVAMPGLYRPFTKQWLHYSRRLNHRVSRMPAIFPEPGLDNRVIAVTGIGARAGFSCLMADALPCLDMVEKGQCFPLYRYDALDAQHAPAPGGLLGQAGPGEVVTAPSGRRYRKRHAITAQAMALVRKAWPRAGEGARDAPVTEEDVFHYLYGILHSEDYRTRFAANLAKELPRLPLVPTWERFKIFREAGRALGELHTGFETLEPWPVTTGAFPRPVAQGNPAPSVIDDPVAFYRVEKMRFGGPARNPDRTTVHYNANITLRDIPPEAWAYEVNGKPALTWVMERQQVKTDKASGIVSDPNAWAVETMKNPAWPFELFCRVITLALETRKIVMALPGLDLPPAPG